MARQQDIQALGQEHIGKLLLKFSLPCVLGLLIGSFYNIVDQMFIGNSELGYLGNAAPLSDLAALLVILCLTVPFFRHLKKQSA